MDRQCTISDHFLGTGHVLQMCASTADQNDVNGGCVMFDADPWALVLAAGEGTRLRSLTTSARGRTIPKQFLRDGDSAWFWRLRSSRRQTSASSTCWKFRYHSPIAHSTAGVCRITVLSASSSTSSAASNEATGAATTISAAPSLRAARIAASIVEP